MKKQIEVKKIIDSGQLIFFLLGQNGLHFVNIYSDMPTDPNLVIRYISDYLGDASDNCAEWRVVKDNLLKLLDSPEGTWLFCYYFLSLMSFSRKQKKLSDCLNLPSLYSKLIKSIANFESELKVDKRWTGSSYDNGLLGDILRLINILKQDYPLLVV